MSPVVVVTGASGGIGSAIVERFGAERATVVPLDLAEGFDVTSPSACSDAVGEVLGRFGSIDVLCNNAGIAAVGDVVSSTPQEWSAVFAVNVFGPANMSRAVLPAMRKARSGCIVNICSIAASVGLVERAVYSASKGALLALTRAMAADEAAYGIRVNSVSPATVDGPWVHRLTTATADPERQYDLLRRRQPLGRLVAAAEVAEAVTYLAHPATFTTGFDLTIDGGIAGVRLVEQ
jgi:NAD(P)-dependent dehydrogenase (short-subunit alcohol dehydrogenase family)